MDVTDILEQIIFALVDQTGRKCFGKTGLATGIPWFESRFSAGKKLTVDKRLLQCGNEIYSAIKDLQSKAPDKNIVIFTHNHCLTYIAKDKRDATFKPDYLDGLVMHVEKGKVYLDGEFVNH